MIDFLMGALFVALVLGWIALILGVIALLARIPE